MGNTPSIQPPVNGIGQAVLYVNGFSYFLQGCGQQCSYSSPELLSPPTSSSTGIGGITPQSAHQVPRELEGCSVSPQEFATAISQINATAKRLIPGGRMNCRALGLLGCLSIVGLIVLLVGLGICEDDSPKDYWRPVCEEMEDDCRSRLLKPLDDYYPECRSSCTANMSDEELRLTPNPDGGQCLLCAPALNRFGEYRHDELDERGCQCVPTEDVRRTRCEVQKDKGRTAPGCREFEYIRVCDDVTHPLVLLGFALLICGFVVGLGSYVWVLCLRNPSVDRDLATLCQTLTRQSQTGTAWSYVAFEAGIGKSKQFYKCVVATSARQGSAPLVVATDVRPVKLGAP